MAANVTSAYAIGVTITSDASGFATGVQQAETAVQGLATTTQTAAAEIDTALATDVPASADKSAVGLTTKASKFKAVGTQLGTDLVGGLTSGLSGPEAITNTGNNLSGLLAASATTAGGAIAAVGIGAGVAFVTAVVNGMNDAKERITEKTEEIFANLELTAKTSLADVREAINETFSLENTVSDLGAGDYAAGLRKVEDVAADIGIRYEDILDLLRRGIVPSTEDTYQALVDAREQGTLLHGTFFNSRLQMDDTAKAADDLVGEVQTTTEAMRRTNEAARDTVAYFDNIDEKARAVGAATNTIYQNIFNANQEAANLGRALGNAAAGLADFA